MLRMIILSFALVVGSTQSGFASLIQNGSFEQAPDVVGKKHKRTYDQLRSSRGRSWDVWDTLPGWTTESGYGIEIQSARTLKFINAADGDFYVELDSNRNTTIFQDVLLTAGHYALEFSYSPRVKRSNTNPIQYTVGSLVNEWVTGPVGALYPWGKWTKVRSLFEVVAPGMYRITFAAGGTSDSFGGLLDRVSLIADNSQELPTNIPIPASLLLLAGAIGGIVSIRRKSAAHRG